MSTEYVSVVAVAARLASVFRDTTLPCLGVLQSQEGNPAAVEVTAEVWHVLAPVVAIV
jgi:hypothetical protein